MAKKKAEAEEKEIENIDEPEIDYKDIHENDFKEIPVDEVPEPKTDPEPEKTPESDKKDEGKPEETPAEPKIDIEELTRKTAEETAKKTREEIADFLKGTPKEEEKLDEYEEFTKKFSEENGRTPTYAEALKFVKDQAKAEILADQEAERKKIEDEQKAVAEKRENDEKLVSNAIDEEMTELYNAGKLTKIKNPDDPNDQGVIERRALFQTMVDVNAKRVAEGLSPIYSPVRVHALYFKRPNRQPAGENAFAIDNRGGNINANEDEDIDYLRDVKGKRWTDFIPFKRK